MNSLIISFIIAVCVGVLNCEFAIKCKSPQPVNYYDEQLLWYRYGGSTPCESCCFTRNMTMLEDGSLDVTDTLKKYSQTSVYDFNAKRKGKHSLYHIQNSANAPLIIDTDCQNYGVVYDSHINELQIFISQFPVNESFINSLEGIKKCGMKYYRYSPEIWC